MVDFLTLLGTPVVIGITTVLALVWVYRARYIKSLPAPMYVSRTDKRQARHMHVLQ